MDIALIQRQFNEARQYFTYLELHPTIDGKVYVRAALQPSAQQYYTLSIYFSDTYPNEMPKVYINKPEINSSPHRYNTGNICYLYPSMWNPGRHNLLFVIQKAAKWLSKYEVWKQNGGIWPGAEIKH